VSSESKLQDAINLVLEAIMPLGISNTPEWRERLSAITTATVAAFESGALTAIESAPWEVSEVAYRSRVTPEIMKPMLMRGWEPWALTECIVPPDPAKKGVQQSAPGWLVRYKRRHVPVDEAEQVGKAN
jgi:hypothetical protein